MVLDESHLLIRYIAGLEADLLITVLVLKYKQTRHYEVQSSLKWSRNEK